MREELVARLAQLDKPRMEPDRGVAGFSDPSVIPTATNTDTQRVDVPSSDPVNWNRALEQDVAGFESALPELRKHAQFKHALIHAGQVIATFDSRRAALELGYEQFGLNEPFLVSLVTNEHENASFDTLIAECRSLK